MRTMTKIIEYCEQIINSELLIKKEMNMRKALVIIIDVVNKGSPNTRKITKELMIDNRLNNIRRCLNSSS